MILSLKEALQPQPGQEQDVQMRLSSTPITNHSAAIEAGRKCGAMIVLWERSGSQTLELTLPNPTRIPLRALVQKRLCEFGNHRQQLDILYLTIKGLMALLDENYKAAHLHLTTASQMDGHCLQLPPSGTGNSASKR